MDLFVHKGPVNAIFDRFPAGETLVRIEDEQTYHTTNNNLYAQITLNFKSNGDLIDLALLVDAVRRKYRSTHLVLNLPYLPYARQDRVCNPGESLSIKVICDFINSLNFDRVYCNDIHSEVGVALLNNLSHIDLINSAAALGKIFHDELDDVVLVSPDAGANKKVLNFAKHYKFPNVVRADKKRNVLTGEIIETIVYSEHVGNKDFLILDDLCDGGFTFIQLAKELRKLTTGKIYLYVTHGIFSKGAGVFEGVIDGIYTANLMGKPHNLIKEI